MSSILRAPSVRFTVLLFLAFCGATAAAAEPGGKSTGEPSRSPAGDVYQVGAARIDVTPDYPIRLNGFGFRRAESEGVSQRIWAKALAIGADDEHPAILITLDNLGVRMSMVDEVARRLKERTEIPRDRVALTFSHSHCAPKVNGASDNIFSQPIPAKHQKHIDRYTRELTDKLESVALEALKNRRPARLAWAVGQVGFAKNRRTPGGPVDHALPMLVVRTLEGEVRAVYVSYACHCVTLSHNLISGDWAGYAQELIERKFPGAVALVSIGAGSDSNPQSGVTGDKVEVAAAQGAEIADEVVRLLSGALQPLRGQLQTQLKFIKLPLNAPPSEAELRALAAKGGPAGYNATTQLARLERGESLPDHIDYPIQTWTFGDSLAVVFLAGEVCVDYSIRLKSELDSRRLWVNAYSNDFCSYIPSERLVREGGYGGGAEIPYFALPNTLQAGLEQRIIAETKRQLKPFVVAPGTQGVPPKTPEDSRQSLRTHDRLRVELVASEPLLDDPVAIDFGADGRLWVVEMPDYTRATEAEFTPHGRVKFLRDTDQDGVFDEATEFLNGLRFPTDVKVWREGVLVCDAPDILWAADTDGDGKADQTKKLFSGFATHNPHARVNSLRLGLDNWLYGSGGLFGGKITSFTGRTVDVSGRDFRLRPETGEIEPVTGRTQQGRVRDDWGNWFGCDNGTILRHYPLADHYLRRNPHVAPPPSAVFVPDYPPPGQLFPTGELVRFKLSGPAGRPTSVCGLGIYRDRALGAEFEGNSFVCEPVNQLVHRLILEERGATVTGRRAEDEQDREFLTSTDRWFRPVQVRTGPDGALWVVDMYRYVIEHPRWIPEETRRQLDTFAGTGMGRIYRIIPDAQASAAWPRFDDLSPEQWAARIDDSNGTVRDMLQQLLTWRDDPTAVSGLQNVVREGSHPGGRMQALATLDGLERVDEPTLLRALRDEHPGVRRHAIRIAESQLDASKAIRDAVFGLAKDPSVRVRLQLACSLGEARESEAAEVLATLLIQSAGDPYLRAAAVSSLHQDNLATVLRHVMAAAEELPRDELPRDEWVYDELLAQLLATATNQGDGQAPAGVFEAILPGLDQPVTPRHLRILRRLLEVAELPRRDESASKLPGQLARVIEHARKLALDDAAETTRRIDAARLLAHGDRPDRTLAGTLIAPRQPLPLQRAAVESLGEDLDDETAMILVAAWSSTGPVLRPVILDTMLTRREGAEALLRSIEAGTIQPGDLDAARRARLGERLGETHAGRLAALLKSTGSQDRAAVIEAYRAATEMPGDPEAGRLVFGKICADCHRLADQGHRIGPDLAALTNKSPAALLRATLDPSRDVDARYLNYVAADAEGRIMSGILTEETGTSITIVEPAGKQRVILRRDLEALRATGKSFMPDGLEKDLRPRDLADLFAYIASSGPVPKQFAGNSPAPVAPDDSGQLRLTAAAAEIYGNQIRFEPPFGNIGYWHDATDHVRWRFRVPESAAYDVYLDWACADGSAGNRYRIDGLGEAMRGQVASTGGWDKYRRAKAGSVTLEAGQHHLTVRPDGELTAPALFDLRAVYLVPQARSPRVAAPR